MKDLGILFDYRLTFEAHITKTIRRAEKMWFFIVRNTICFSGWESIRYLYVTLIKSILLYGSTIWRPFYKNGIYVMEKLQHRALRYMAMKDKSPMHKFNHDYHEVAIKFRLPSIESSMEIVDLLFLFKIVAGNVNCVELSDIVPMNRPRYNVRNVNLFYPYVGRARYFDREPINRMCSLYNLRSLSLPELRDFSLNVQQVASLLKNKFWSFYS